MAEYYRDVIGTEAGLRRGLSSGSCAQAAAKAALLYFLRRHAADTVEITLPKGSRCYSGKRIIVPVESASMTEDSAEAFVRKDAGDDKDCTNGLLFGARVTLTDDGEIVIDGGEGVGRITKPGVAGKVGEAAINPVPRKMIAREIRSVLPEGMGCRVTVFVPDGGAAAEHTWNPRIGILGGISIIGTKGVVEPKSEDAYKTSINTIIHNYRKNGMECFIITPGYVGEKFLGEMGVSMTRVVTVGDYVGHALTQTVKRGAKKIILAGHIGKLSKIAAGIFHTHWKCGDARLEVIAAYTAACGADSGVVRTILSLNLAEDALRIIRDNNLEAAYGLICQRIIWRIEKHIDRKCEIGCVLLSLSGEPLAAAPEQYMEAEAWRGFR